MLKFNEESIVEQVIEIKYNQGMPTVTQENYGNWVDLYTANQEELAAGEFKLLSLGVRIKLPQDCEALVIPRSSTFKRYGIIMANSIGLIDSTYCGNNDIWQFPAYATRFTRIPKHTRICQFRVLKSMPPIIFKEVENMKYPDRGGFGSTGV